MSSQNLAMNTANHQVFFAPIKLKRFTQLKPERHINRFTRGTLVAPLADKVSDHGITTGVTLSLDLGKQHECSTSVFLGAMYVSLQCQQQFGLKWR